MNPKNAINAINAINATNAINAINSTCIQETHSLYTISKGNTPPHATNAINAINAINAKNAKNANSGKILASILNAFAVCISTAHLTLDSFKKPTPLG